MMLSFIIPVYNAEKYISRCIESILALDSSDIEIIVVNDGSQDASRQIIEAYPVVLINQENAGVSAARNRGIKAAKGKYIAFVDADDYIDTDQYKKLLSYLSDEPAYMMGYRVLDGTQEHTVKPILEAGKYGLKEIDFLKRCLTDVSISKNQNTNYLGGKVYQYAVRKDVFEDICFPEGMPYAEDLCYCMQLFNKINSIVVTDLITYNYCINPQSAMHHAREFFWEEYGMVIDFVRPYIDEIARNRLIYWAALGVINSYIAYNEYVDKISKVVYDPLFQKAVHHLEYDGWTKKEWFELTLLKNKMVRLWILYKRLIKNIRNRKLGGYETKSI